MDVKTECNNAPEKLDTEPKNSKTQTRNTGLILFFSPQFEYQHFLN